MIRDPILVQSVLEPAAQAVTPNEPGEHKTAWITVWITPASKSGMALGNSVLLSAGWRNLW